MEDKAPKPKKPRVTIPAPPSFRKINKIIIEKATFRPHILKALDFLRYDEATFASHPNGIEKLFRALENPECVENVVDLLLQLAQKYSDLYRAYFEKFNARSSSSVGAQLKNMINRARSRIDEFEAERSLIRSHFALNWCSIPSVAAVFDSFTIDELGSITTNPDTHSKAIFMLIEESLYREFWKYVRHLHGTSMDSLFVEPSGDFTFSNDLLQKLYEIAGYISGYRMKNAIKYRLVSSKCRDYFQNYITFNSYDNASDAERNGLPSGMLYQREKWGGLYYVRRQFFSFLCFMHYIFDSIMSSSTMILCNADNPSVMVTRLILESKRVQELFAATIPTARTGTCRADLHISNDMESLCFRFIVRGYTRLMLKDRYQLYLNNALGCRTGAALRTELSVISKLNSQAPVKASTTTVSSLQPALTPSNASSEPKMIDAESGGDGDTSDDGDVDYDEIAYDENDALTKDIEETFALYGGEDENE